MVRVATILIIPMKMKRAGGHSQSLRFNSRHSFERIDQGHTKSIS